jgi:hypothetical protein
VVEFALHASVTRVGGSWSEGRADAIFLGQKTLRMGNLKKLDYWSEPSSGVQFFKIKTKEEKGGGGGACV